MAIACTAAAFAVRFARSDDRDAVGLRDDPRRRHDWIVSGLGCKPSAIEKVRRLFETAAQRALVEGPRCPAHRLAPSIFLCSHCDVTSERYRPLRATSCSCVPRSAIIPRSRTMISSASRIVLNRCAMIKHAQPRRRRLSSMRCSVSGIERARRLVEHHQRRIAHQRASDFEALSLTAAEVHAAFRYRGFVRLGPADDVGVNAGVARGALDRRIGDGGIPQGEITANRPGIERNLLVYERRPPYPVARGRSHRVRCRRIRPVPTTALNRPETSLAIVDFPLPDGPTSAMRRPGAMTNEISRTAGGACLL